MTDPKPDLAAQMNVYQQRVEQEVQVLHSVPFCSNLLVPQAPKEKPVPVPNRADRRRKKR